jgi:hypothetical protein
MCDDYEIDKKDWLAEERVKQIAGGDDCAQHIAQVLAIELLVARRAVGSDEAEIERLRLIVRDYAAQRKATAKLVLELRAALAPPASGVEYVTMEQTKLQQTAQALIGYLEQLWAVRPGATGERIDLIGLGPIERMAAS